MARIENHKYTVAEAFQECFYVVPDYQREYVWTDKEAQQLLEDIDEQIDSGSDKVYFVGMILVSKGSPRPKCASSFQTSPAARGQPSRGRVQPATTAKLETFLGQRQANG